MSEVGTDGITAFLLQTIPTMMDTIKESIKIKNLKTELKIEEISNERSRMNNESRKKNRRHQVLAEQIFYPLYQNIVMPIYLSLLFLQSYLPHPRSANLYIMTMG